MCRLTHVRRICRVIDITDVPDELAQSQADANGAAGRDWIAGLPEQANAYVEQWRLRRTGPSMHGMTALVLPVERADGTPAALKLQLLDEESAGEPVALKLWGGDGAVRVLEHDEASGALLLERLDASRHLSALPDPMEAVRIIAELLARLTAVPAPEGMRSLGDIAGAMLDDVPHALRGLVDQAERRLLERCAGAVREVAGEPGDRLLHWDLHEDNVLAPLPGSGREPWIAIDPKPLAGDPGFDLWPALDNRFDAAQVLPRFDLMTEVLGLDRERARAWTLGRLLQNGLWDVEDGESRLQEEQVVIGKRLLGATP
ncbi:aminoglycoside phosphotransferase family protein [Streptomyces sp. H27-C3]|uniref:aminoglycoside phosphotransferase family protein n=1 Tax=Streptomyces sp. H27-C3 TaxID=3046305 RepID=UPI0024B9311F|nr:aminoglycoside phosphotransferase family protein [Streptomyces sp. H27-C3]MDJ0464944.1 aminoglycoside phosphotransferase family protein [Streptomyces sp. H27-C3]